MKLSFLYPIFLFAFLGDSSCWAFNKEDILDLRLLNAQGFFQKNQDKKGLRLIYQNLLNDKIHLPTYRVLSQYHVERLDYKKALKTIMTAISKTHGRQVLKIGHDEYLKERIKKLKSPSPLIISLYAEIQKICWQAYQETLATNPNRDYYLKMTEKYSLVLKQYKYKAREMTLTLTQINEIRKNNQFKIKELAEGQDSALTFQLGKSLIKDGREDLGLVYLRGISEASNSNPVIEQTANYYLQKFHESSGHAIVSTSLASESNLHELNSDQLTNFDSSTYGEESGVVQKTDLQLILQKKWSDQSSLFVDLRGRLDRVFNQSSNIRDQNLIELGFSQNYLWSKKSSIRLDYTLTRKWQRNVVDGPFDRAVTNQLLSPRYSYLLKDGVISYFGFFANESGSLINASLLNASLQGSSLNLSNIDTDNISATQLGFGANYAPYFQTPYFDFDFSVAFGNQEEIYSESSSTFFNLSLINKSQLKKDWTVLSFAQFYYKSNEEEFVSFFESFFRVLSLYQLDWLQGLNFEVGTSLRNRSFSDSNSASDLTIESGLSYSF